MPRRRAGSIVRHDSARGIVVRIRYADATGHRVCETLGLESEGWSLRKAEETLRERLVDVKRDKLTRARPLRFEEFARDALETYLDAKGRRHSTRSGYLAVLDQHLAPHFGRMQLDTIEPADVDAYIAKKRRAGLSAATVNRQLNVLRRVCKLAIRAGRMRSTPFASVEALEEPDRRLRWRRLQPEEVGAVAQAFDELIADAEREERPWVEQARVVFLVVYGLGLRRGEVLGLRWRSVRLADPEQRPTLSVESATVRGRDGAPKSATSRRTLVLDEFLASELFDHRGRSRYQGDDERVFCHPLKGSSLDHKRYAATFRDALARAGITDYVRPFHDGRHSAITNDAAAGNSGLAVMRRAGHSDFRTTQMYLDLAGVEFAEEAERAAARVFAHVPRAKVRATDGAE
jgi:integrase